MRTPAETKLLAWTSHSWRHLLHDPAIVRRCHAVLGEAPSGTTLRQHVLSVLGRQDYVVRNPSRWIWEGAATASDGQRRWRLLAGAGFLELELESILPGHGPSAAVTAVNFLNRWSAGAGGRK